MTQEAKTAIPNARILLVGIETNTCKLLQRLLSQHYELEVVAEGGDALIAVHQLKQIPDLILADATMPEGFEWLRSLRAEPKTRELPIILLSTQTEEDALVSGLRAGANDYVIKPFFAHGLLARIKVNLKLAQLPQSTRHREQNLHTVTKASQCAEASNKEQEQHLRLANERFELAAVASNCMIYDWNLQQDTVDRTQGLTRILGYSLKDAELTGNWWRERIHPEDRQHLRDQAAAMLATRDRYAVEYRVLNQDNQYVDVLDQGIVGQRDAKGNLLHLVGSITDITARKRAEEALRRSEIRYQRLIANLPGMVYQYLPCEDGPDAFMYVSSSSHQLFELAPETVLQDAGSLWKLIYPDDLPSLQHSVAVAAKNSLPWQWEGRIITPSGQIKWIQGNSRPQNTDNGMVWDGLLLDITERKQAEKHLQYNAFHDALTGLPNRALFVDRLMQAIARVKRHKDYLFAVLFLDLDRFKVINDSLGHLFGDQLLLAIASRLKAHLRPTDTIARLGGDEFTILLEGFKNFGDVLRLINRIQQELTIPFTLNGQEMFTSASIGIALSTTGYNQPEDILRDADIAMYQAKAKGRGCYEFFTTDMHLQAVTRLKLETELRQAIDRQEFRVYYLPIVSLATGRLTGFEALVRWQHPQQGIVLPGQFIPMAVEAGLSIAIDQWVLHEACRQTKQWQEQFSRKSVALNVQKLTISVNLGKPQFMQQQLVLQIRQVLQETGLDAKSLKLEIVESALMEHGDGVTEKLNLLRNEGIHLDIDDFGTGYSSLGRLHRFPINGLKIDRSFISGGDVEQGLAIVETIVTLAKKLGVEATAEGLETAEQLALVRRLNCEFGQGYFFSRPLDSSTAEALIAANPQW
ncbi:MAG: EAL domain-containing protein [Chroococcidiopsidaceae cyanobacterium CP_BM_ER_R8_30]|nr:EAL domain-containing protein [Chroococcidiopsidaceae cyanobacterium CP_BM_ER_R8_30]